MILFPGFRGWDYTNEKNFTLCDDDLKKFYLPDHADFGLDLPEDYGTITYYDNEGKYHEETVETVQGDNGRFYDALYETIIHGAAPLVTEAQTMAQMRILEEATAGLK